MKKLKTELLQSLCDRTRDQELPYIKQIITPTIPEHPPTEKTAKFGALLLEDDSCGFIYTLLEEDLVSSDSFAESIEHASNSPALEIAQWYLSDDIGKRYIGMATINAVSQHLFEQSGFFRQRPQSEKTDKQTEHMGMIGFFPPLVKKFREAGQKLTVIEQNPDFVESGENFEVTQDLEKLKSCDEVLCTASTLLNDSLVTIINASSPGIPLSLIGPTAGCLPDALFNIGVTEIGASRVLYTDKLIQRIRKSEPWGDSVEKYTIRAENYSGLNTIS